MAKEARERKNEILDAAEYLFARKGYDGTSTGDILSRVGIARGTLYYHFRSKEEILDMLVERISYSLIENARQVAAGKDIPAVDRIVAAVNCLKPRSDIGGEILEQVHRPQNALMHQKMERILLEGVTPVLAEIIEDGVKERVFDTKHPLYAAELLLVYAEMAFDEAFEQTESELLSRVEAFIYHAERVLGAKEGSLQKPFRDMFSQIDKL